MLKTILRKTIFEKRYSTLMWSVALLLFVVLTAVLFPALRDSFGESLKNVPDSLKSLIGNAADYQTIAGYIDIQIFQQYTFITIAFGVILATGLLAGDEGDGTLQHLLTHPVSRSRVYLEKLAALMALLAVTIIFVGVGVVVGCMIIGQDGIGFFRLLLAMFDLWLITLVFSLIGYCIGAITGKRGLAGALAGLAAFVCYLVTTLSGGVKSLKALNNFSPFHYYNNPSVLRQGLEVGDVLILLAVCVVLGLVGYVVFVKRDIYQA